MPAHRIYLDNAATSWPKPPAVYDAVNYVMRELGAPAGRGAYREASEVERLVVDARRRIAALIGAAEPRSIIFTANGTDALNTAIHGVLRPGDHVVTTVCEHNSVLRPLRHQQQFNGVEVTHVGCSTDGLIDPADMRAAIRPTTRLLCVVHVSNVTGAVLPIAELGAIAHQYRVPFLVDAAQSLGHLEIDVGRDAIDLLAAPGHKGLLGPLGTGVLYVSPEVADSLRPLRQGGTGTASDWDEQPAALPERFEAGNLNVPGIAGLAAGTRWLAAQGRRQLHEQSQQLLEQLQTGLSAIPGVELYGPAGLDQRAGLLSFNLAGWDPRDVAAMLDSAARIQVRSGLHCAPRIHAALGTLSRGGSVRISIGPFNTPDHIAAALDALRQIAAAA